MRAAPRWRARWTVRLIVEEVLKRGIVEAIGRETIRMLPPRVIDGGLPEPGLLAHVVILKYEDHQPINRPSKIFAREGVTVRCP